MKTKDLIEKRILEKDIDNIQKTRTFANSYCNGGNEEIKPAMLKKLKRLSVITGMSVQDIMRRAAEDDLVALHLCKKASRQRVAEETQIGVLNRGGHLVTKLQSSGGNSLKLHKGSVISGRAPDLSATKSIDALAY